MVGFTKEEMDEKLQSIIDFAEIGDFINQPVKTYSSGMFARLAFAVAINVEPDILIVDEALSVGDIFFQSKCYQKFLDFKKAGKTILFVSHDRMFLKKMATRVLEMDSVGKIYDLNYEEYLDKKANNELIESVAKVEKEVKPQTVSFTDLKAIKNRVAKLEVLLDEAEQDLEAMRELRYEPEYYQDYRKMEELDAKIDDKHNEIAALMKEWEEKMAMME